MTAIPSAAAFHRHLDTCRQCRENPLKLCAAGHALLTSAANETDDPHPPHRQCGCLSCLPSFDDDAIVPTHMARAPEIVDGVE